MNVLRTLPFNRRRPYESLVNVSYREETLRRSPKRGDLVRDGAIVKVLREESF